MHMHCHRAMVQTAMTGDFRKIAVDKLFRHRPRSLSGQQPFTSMTTPIVVGRTGCPFVKG
jgi:hypothetical protein